MLRIPLRKSSAVFFYSFYGFTSAGAVDGIVLGFFFLGYSTGSALGSALGCGLGYSLGIVGFDGSFEAGAGLDL